MSISPQTFPTETIDFTNQHKHTRFPRTPTFATSPSINVDIIVDAWQSRRHERKIKFTGNQSSRAPFPSPPSLCLFTREIARFDVDCLQRTKRNFVGRIACRSDKRGDCSSFGERDTALFVPTPQELGALRKGSFQVNLVVEIGSNFRANAGRRKTRTTKRRRVTRRRCIRHCRGIRGADFNQSMAHAN